MRYPSAVSGQFCLRKKSRPGRDVALMLMILAAAAMQLTRDIWSSRRATADLGHKLLSRGNVVQLKIDGNIYQIFASLRFRRMVIVVSVLRLWFNGNGLIGWFSTRQTASDYKCRAVKLKILSTRKSFFGIWEGSEGFHFRWNRQSSAQQCAAGWTRGRSLLYKLAIKIRSILASNSIVPTPKQHWSFSLLRTWRRTAAVRRASSFAAITW